MTLRAVSSHPNVAQGWTEVEELCNFTWLVASCPLHSACTSSCTSSCKTTCTSSFSSGSSGFCRPLLSLLQVWGRVSTRAGVVPLRFANRCSRIKDTKAGGVLARQSATDHSRPSTVTPRLFQALLCLPVVALSLFVCLPLHLSPGHPLPGFLSVSFPANPTVSGAFFLPPSVRRVFVLSLSGYFAPLALRVSNGNSRLLIFDVSE